MAREAAHQVIQVSERLIVPNGYNAKLSLRETEEAIKFIKDYFQTDLTKVLNLTRVSAPLIVLGDTGVNDHLNGTEKPVDFIVKDMSKRGEVVQSLAKWKRMALGDYDFKQGEGLYTDMNALRPDEMLDNLHSVYVDQWDWERVIRADERNLDFLKLMVEKIYDVLKDTEQTVCAKYPQIVGPMLPERIHFIHTETMEEMYPELSPKEREDKVVKEYGAVFIIGIGAPLKNGDPHDGRAADYDDWISPTYNGHHGLNGDIVIWSSWLDMAFELSSMGIRVDKDSLALQLEERDENFKKEMDFHKKLLNDELPLTIGGGIGQSRLCMYLLRRAHVGEVQASIWPEDLRALCLENGITLL